MTWGEEKSNVTEKKHSLEYQNNFFLCMHNIDKTQTLFNILK